MKGSVFQLLGLSQRAGKAVSGDYIVREHIAKGKAKLLIVASDTSERIKKDYIRMGHLQKVPTVVALTKQELGDAMGKSPRASVVILDPNFAQELGRLLEGGEA